MEREVRKVKRVIVAKSDQDAHELSVRYLAHLLRESGMEVIFLRYLLIDEVAKAAVEEDVSLIALCFYGSGLMQDTSKMLDLLRGHKMEDVNLIVGGTINKQEKERLQEMGVKQVFMPGVGTLQDVADNINTYMVVEGRGDGRTD